MGLIGGIGSKIDADQKIRDICSQIKPDAEKKLGKNYNKFEPICYKKQIVAGTNYFVKVQVDDGFNHYRIFVGLPQGEDKEVHPQLVSVQQHKTLEDDITIF